MEEARYMSSWLESEVIAPCENFLRFQSGFERLFLEADITTYSYERPSHR